MRSSLLFIFLAQTFFIVFASDQGNILNYHNYEIEIDELEALFGENDIILPDLMSSMTTNPSEGSNSTLKPPVPTCVRVDNPATSKKTNLEMADFELRESLYKIFHTQVSKAKFDLRDFEIEGWPGDVDRLKPRWNSTEIFKIRQKMNNFKFKHIPRITFAKQHGSDASDVNFSYDQSLKKVEVIETLKQRYRIESRHTDAERIEWKQLDRSKLPLKYDRLPINGNTMILSKYWKCPEIVDNIHFHPLSDFELFRKSLKKQGKTSKRNNYELSQSEDLEIRDSLYKLFHIQMPNIEFDLRNFEIQGWPQGVDKLKPIWNSTEIFVIRLNFSKFKFIPKQIFADACPVDFDYDPNLNEKEVFERLKNRYRIESRHTDADRIDWKQLDRSKIPKKYDSVPINGHEMKIAQIRRCPEIVDNIHFHPLSDYELFCKAFTRGTKHHYVISKYKKIQVAQGIYPDPKYELETVNGLIVRTINGVPVLANQNSSSDKQAEESPQPNFLDEEFEKLLAELMVPETETTSSIPSSLNMRKRTFDQMESQNSFSESVHLLESEPYLK